jgi:hypothetical protein
MRFLLLIKHDERPWLANSNHDKEKTYEEYRALIGELARLGYLVEADQCTARETAKVVRLRQGETEIQSVSGPAAEQIAGYFLLDPPSHADALRVAERIPGARTGSIEVWPISPRQQATAQ